MKTLSLLAVAILASVSQAGTIYTPVQYEYGSGNDRYYYGGNDPQVHLRAERAAYARQITGRVFDSKPQVYTDALPHHINAAAFRVTPADARNEAYASVPRYFRMSAGRPVVRDTPATTKPGVILIIPKAKNADLTVAAAK